MKMFERLLDLLVSLWDRAAPGEIVDVYAGGGVLRMGKYHRTLEPGYHWKWPFIERVVEVLTCETTQRVPPQSLTTKDGVSIVAACIVRFQISDVEKYVSLIWDQQDVLLDVTAGAVRKATCEMNWAELLVSPPEDTVVKLVRAAVNKYGFKIHNVTFSDLAKAHSIRLIQPQPANDVGTTQRI
jgi:regulator of protease activity HflC (stomatin/prohibitin superfamily)